MHSNVLALVVFLVLAAVVPVGATAPAAGATGAALAQEDCTFPVTVTDATGTDVTIEEEPESIVVLQASAAQVMWELEIQDRVVGMPVASYTSYLDGSESKQNVINQDGSVNQEQVVALSPDIVLAPNVIPNETVEGLRSAGMTVYKSGFPSSLDGIREKVSLYGRFTGTCDRAETVNAEFDAAVESVRENASDRYQPRTFYYFFNFTAGQGTFINDIIDVAGGRNVAAEAGVTGFRQVNLEQVAERDPEVIFVASDSPMPSGEPWNSTTAFQEGNVYRVNTNLLNQPAPRVVEPMRTMQRSLADRAEAVTTETPTATPAPPEPTQSPTPEMTTEPPTETPEPETAETSTDGQPGLTALSAVLALLAAALLASRRR